MSLVAPGIAGDVREPGPQRLDEFTPHSGREGRLDDSSDAAWGRSESLDPDNVGDIADEGMGHRG
ncbi:MAG TPA: hypothetical protein VF159_02685 [Gemmatimonadaceae bacterium]